MSVSFLNIVPNIAQNHVEMLNGVFSCRIKRLNGTRCPATVEICCWNAFRAAKKRLQTNGFVISVAKICQLKNFHKKHAQNTVFFSEMQSNYASFMTSRSNSDQTFNLHIKYIYTITWLDLTHDLKLNIYTYIYIHIYDQVKYRNFEKTWITWEDDWKVHSLSTPGRLYTYYIYIYIMSTLD